MRLKNATTYIGSSLSIDDCYLLYVDKLGTGSDIRKDDPDYGNREGFYGMAPLYIEPHEVLAKALGKDFKYFAFSDTVISILEIDDTNLIGKLAAKIFFSLLEFSIPSRVFITRGDFSFHRFEQLADEPNAFLCPIYGTTLLDAYALDQLGIKCLGAFTQKKIAGNFETMQNVLFQSESSAGVLDLSQYLTEEEMLKIKLRCHDIQNANNRAVAQHCSTLVEALSGKSVVIKTNDSLAI